MATIKRTFSLDPETSETLDRTAERLDLPKSEVVREAITEYAERVGRLGEAERRRLLAAFDELVPKVPERPAEEVDRELAALRQARRSGGRGGGKGQP
jgi:predicted transcriptional regulator